MDPLHQEEQQHQYHQPQYYSQEQDPGSGYMQQQYAPHMQPAATGYHSAVGGQQTRGQLDLQQQGMHQHHSGHYSQPLLPSHQYQFTASSPPHVPPQLALAASPPPPSPDMYEAMSPNLSGSDTSGEGIYRHSSASSGGNSPSSSRGNSLVHRTHRANHNHNHPTPSPTSSIGRRSRGRSRGDSDDDEPEPGQFIENLAHSRKEATRRQRIEAEQRRRDELRDGYAKLKDVLPVSNQKSNKVNLLERATTHIVSLEKNNSELQGRIDTLEREIQRLRSLNDKIAVAHDGGSRQLTPLDSNMDTRGQGVTPSASSSPSAHSEY